MQRRVHRRRPFQGDVKIGCHGARRRILAGLLHEMHGRGPVAVAIEQCAANAAVEDAVEGLMMRLRPPLADQLIPFGEAPDAKPLVIGRAASEAAVVRRVGFLKALHTFANATTSGKKARKRRSNSWRESIRWCVASSRCGWRDSRFDRFVSAMRIPSMSR